MSKQYIRVLGATGFVACVLSLLVLSLSASGRKSPTFDEAVHLYAGYAYLKWGDFRINPEHPPLAKMWAALPLMVMNLKTTYRDQIERDVLRENLSYGWILANRFVYVENDGDTLFFYSRIMMVTLAASLGLCIFCWARELYGVEPALLALFLFCFDPNVLGHASVVQTDIPFTLFFFASTFFFWRVCNELTWLNLLLTAALFAAAAVTKFSFVAILPIWLVLGAAKLVSVQPFRSRITLPETVVEPRQKVALLSSVLVAALLTGYLAIWTVYRLRFDAVPLAVSQMPIIDGSLSANRVEQWASFLGTHFVLPEAWISGISAAYLSTERVAYLFGEISGAGFWMYFPVAFLTKTPIPTLILCFGASVLMLLGDKRKDAYFLIVPAILYFGVAVASRMNLGLRHILPIYPFLFVWIAGAVSSNWRWWGKRPGKCIAVCCGAWLLSSSLMAYPNYLAFFNGFVGGPHEAIKVLVDSNLDWGQDLKGLKEWMQYQGVEKIQLAYFGTAEPSHYGIRAVYLPGTRLPSGAPVSELATAPPYVAISATHLVGLYLSNRDTYAEFRQQEPVSIIGNSIWVYNLDDKRVLAE